MPRTVNDVMPADPRTMGPGDSLADMGAASPIT